MESLATLRLFRAIADLGSFAAAARSVGLSPAGASKAISELEADLGTRLINRTTRRLHLTEAGSLYLEQVRRALGELEEARDQLASLNAEPSGLLRVSAPMTSSLVLLTERIPEFLDRHPRISLDLDLNDRRVDLVRDGYDLALRGGLKLEDTGLISRRIGALCHVVCAAPAYLARRGTPQVPEELAGHECVRFSLSGHADEWVFERDSRVVRQRVTGRYQVASSLAVRDALRAGFGLSLIPRAYVADDLAAGRLVQLLEGWSTPDVTVHALYPSRRHVPPKVRAFIDFAVDVLHEHRGTRR
ncbi:LysR family transcriptional regulator [Pannonibacter tanglangensis]|uniref:LysR family transcriptional regulator n=1 Tax=Pannonibacter tanglangensis TaxID=2750084 RepID=A0ABW9ZJG3_9HYPH|nr:LysR family transcriptional regulator [Pannonibacter sp. XCT-34]NBN65033.1 LysR family transcriptional regulator [Pannonibacter sp. XCT-34]